jgi:hypothetical protein
MIMGVDRRKESIKKEEFIDYVRFFLEISKRLESFKLEKKKWRKRGAFPLFS